MTAVSPRPRGPRASAAWRGRWLVVCAMATMVVAPALGARAATTPAGAATGRTEARQLLEAAVAALQQPHVGRVSIVTFSPDGPLVADLDVRVDAMGNMELRRPTRWLLGGPGTSWLRTESGAVAVTPAATGARLEVDLVLEQWDATVGPARDLDTGRATPVHLVRRSSAVVEEVVYVDDVTALPVRRETRDADGDVLRVVAYTSLSLVDVGSAASVAAADGHGPGPPEVDALIDDGYDVPDTLPAGFRLVGAGHQQGMAIARYGDGLSALSVYQQHGRLDPSRLDGATVQELAGRHVWAWPGSEPLRLVWTGGDRTWTVVSDAPLEVVEDAIASLPGDHIGHDVPSRISRGLARAIGWVRDLVAS